MNLRKINYFRNNISYSKLPICSNVLLSFAVIIQISAAAFWRVQKKQSFISFSPQFAKF
jgi:hypothetical protein